MSIELASLKVKVIRLKAARLKDAEDHEQAIRAMIRMLAKRGYVIRNLKERGDNWHGNAIRLAIRNTSLNRKLKVLESCIRKERRYNSVFLREVGKIKESSYES